MTENLFHFGKYKGKPLQSVPEHYLEWVVLKHSDKRAVRTAQAELDRRAEAFLAGDASDVEDSPKQAAARTTSQPSKSITTVPKGKYAGQELDELPDETVHALWASWNGSEKLRSHPFFKLIVAEKSRRKTGSRNKKQTKSKVRTAPASPAETHSDWTDSSGRTHSIPSDISMEGREGEESPF